MSTAAPIPRRGEAMALSSIAGYVDTACFVGLYGLFTAHVTGNFVLIGASLVEREPGLLAKLLALPVFLLAVLLTAEAAGRLHWHGRRAAVWLLGAEAVLLSLCIGAVLRGGSGHVANAAAAIAPGMLAVTAMGLQNALMRIELSSLPPTTVMTGNVTQVVIDAWTLWRMPAGDGVDLARKRLRSMLPGVIAFTLGSAAGALSYLVVGLLCLVAPALLCVVLAWRFRDGV